jgi:hypothetical protein
MRINKFLAVGIAGLSLAGAATLPAVAGASHPAAASKTHVFPTTLTPHTVHPGTAMTMKGHGARKSTTYNCVFTVLKGSKFWVGPITQVKSSKKGKVTCHRTFEPYTATSLSGAAPHKCPLTKKDKKHHYRCALSIATSDKASAGNEYFTAKKH